MGQQLVPLVLLTVLAAVPAGAAHDPAGAFDRTLLTSAERDWLAVHPVLHEAETTEGNMEPIEFRDSHGRYAGITADYSALLAQRLGVQLEVVEYPSVESAIAAVESGQADFVGSIVATPERSRKMNLSEPYWPADILLVVRADEPRIRSAADLVGHRVAIEHGIRRRQVLAEAIPDLHFVETADATSAVKSVLSGQADAYVGSAVVVKYLINKLGRQTLEIRGSVDLPPRPWVFGVRPDGLELVSMINRVLASMSEGDRHTIESRWTPVLPERLRWRTILANTWPYLVALTGLVALILAWNQSLRVQIRYRRAAEERARASQELAETANRTKSEFVANVSHEIRTPMNAILGMAGLLARSNLTDNQRDHAVKLQRSAKSLLSILNDLLDLSKIEAGKLEMESVPFELSEVLENCASLLGQDAATKGLELLFAISPELPNALLGDPLRLGQILLNLGSNAIKFTSAGAVIVRVAESGRDKGCITLHFSVSDTGIGMSDSQLERLFQPFSQADPSISRRFGGTGLGLAISHQLVAKLGGRLQATSTPGVGSEFSFESQWPMQPGGSGETIATDGAVAPFGLGHERLLIVSDSEPACTVLATLARALGLQADAVTDGAAALQAMGDAWAAAQPYRIVLIDLKLKGMSAMECLHRMRGAAPGGAAFPAVLLRGDVTGEDAVAPIRASTGIAASLLVNPVLPAVLLKACRRVLEDSAKNVSHEPVEAQRESEATSLRGMRLLVVEDDEISLELAVALLGDAGAQVAVARDGQEALSVLAAGGPFDAVLMDYRMPVMDGYEATRAIRAHPKYRDLLIIATSADTMLGEWTRAQAAGMNERVPKPIDVNLLLGILRRWHRQQGSSG